MKITFLGATKEVTGSNYLVEACGKKFLVDCGLHQGSTREELLNDKPFDFDVKSIDFMLLTHVLITREEFQSFIKRDMKALFMLQKLLVIYARLCFQIQDIFKNLKQ
jgi:metallo-beta-lactamase family protein